MVDQHSLSFRVLQTRVFSDPGNQQVPTRRTDLEDIFCDNIESVFFLLNKEVRIDNRGAKTTDRRGVVEHFELRLIAGD